MRVNVTIPIAGQYNCEIEVPDDATPDQIFAAAIDYHGTSDNNADVEWEFHEYLANGNVLHASCNEWEWHRVKRRKLAGDSKERQG